MDETKVGLSSWFVWLLTSKRFTRFQQESAVAEATDLNFFPLSVTVELNMTSCFSNSNFLAATLQLQTLILAFLKKGVISQTLKRYI